jgi:LemA protein
MIDITVFATMALLLVGYAAVLYSALRRARRRLARAWMHLDFAWDRRDGDLSKLLELCRQDGACDEEQLERVRRAREALQDARRRRDVSAINDTEEALHRALLPVYPLAAGQRDGNAEAVVRALRFRIQGHEQAIAAAHTRYNEAASSLNARIEMLPETLIASLCGMTPVALLQCDASAQVDIGLGLAFSK